MKLQPFKCTPALIALVVTALLGVARLLRWDWCEGLEDMTYDVRVRLALRYSSPPLATNLGFVAIDEQTVQRVFDGSLGYSYGLIWPRQVYGRLVQELSLQGARAVALDVLFKELRPDHPPVKMADPAPADTWPESDQFFAQQMKLASNVIIAVTPEVVPPPLFLEAAATAGDITTDKDADGKLRRARAFRVYRTHWHPRFQALETDRTYGVDLRLARVEAGRIVLPRAKDLGDIVVPLDADGNFEVADLGPPQTPPKARPFVDERIWHMGIVLAARQLNLDLAKAEVDLKAGRIILRGPGSFKRIIPVDRDGFFYVDWSIPENHPRLTQERMEDLLAQYKERLDQATNFFPTPWRGKLAIVGSAALQGNNLTDRGATPLSPEAALVSQHWNVANSIITGRFIRRVPLGLELAVMVAMSVITALITWRWRVPLAAPVLLVILSAYLFTATAAYVQGRFWLPVVFPGFAMFFTCLPLMAWRVMFEQTERRRIRAVFSTVVSPKIVKELLQAGSLSLGGARRDVTVFFADVRGFTEFTDASQQRMAEQVQQRRLSGPEAEACFDEQARETLATVNLYLGLVADTIIQHDGTLDKFIGDCVMAFWGAPTGNPNHALACARAAIEAQRRIYELNRRRLATNQAREAENADRTRAGQPPLPLLPILFLGTGINTGSVTVGLMGSESEAVVRQGSYTVFGREVNLASRLEGASGYGRILISQSTFEHLQHDDPALARTCVPLPPITVKGIREPVQVHELPWRLPGSPPLEEEFGLEKRPQGAPARAVRIPTMASSKL